MLQASVLIKYFLVFLITILHAIFWNYIGSSDRILTCTENRYGDNDRASRYDLTKNSFRFQGKNRNSYSSRWRNHTLSHRVSFHLLLTDKFIKYKKNRLINIRYHPWTLLMTNSGDYQQCSVIINPYVSTKRKFSCLAIVISENTFQSSNLFRYDQVEVGFPLKNSEKRKIGVENMASEEVIKQSTLKNHVQYVTSAGFFDHVANQNGRNLFRSKLFPMLSHFHQLKTYLSDTLRAHGLFPGSALIVMVVNAGEIDILANFLCSCEANALTWVRKNVVIFTPSVDVIPVLRSFGLLGIHHPQSFAYANDGANQDYLDKTFIDLMWYKSFSVWLLLQMGYHVLFQDVDIVWFRDPFPYFERLHNKYQSLNTKSNDPSFPRLPDAVLSDDGQRSLRYTPFYANSGFYFFRSNAIMISIAWMIVTAFDLLHISGSHQNVFTLRLLEGMDLAPPPGLQTLFLPMSDFPSGVKFSHDRPFMQNIGNGIERPFMFHM